MDYDSISPTFCITPWVQQNFDSNGQTKLCCLARGQVGKDGGRYPNNEADAAWNSDYMRDVRRRMKAGEKIEACTYCYEVESRGGVSRRHAWNNGIRSASDEVENTVLASFENDMVTETPLNLDLRFGNLCNLSCKMCSGKSSIQIIKDRARLQKQDPETYAKYYGSSPVHTEQTWMSDPELWRILDEYKPRIEEVYLTGGEPMLVPEAIKFIEECVSEGYASNMNLRMNSNMTMVNKDIVDLAVNFKSAEIVASIDGMGLVGEYIRYPSSWDTVEQNIIHVLERSKENPNLIINACVTVQAYNILHLPDFLDWMIDTWTTYGNPHASGDAFIQINNLIAPRQFNTINLPGAVTKVAHDRLENWLDRNKENVKYFMGEFRNLNMQLLQLTREVEPEYVNWNHLSYADFMDSNKKISMAANIPDLYRLLSDVNNGY